MAYLSFHKQKLCPGWHILVQFSSSEMNPQLSIWNDPDQSVAGQQHVDANLGQHTKALERASRRRTEGQRDRADRSDRLSRPFLFLYGGCMAPISKLAITVPIETCLENEEPNVMGGNILRVDVGLFHKAPHRSGAMHPSRCWIVSCT